MAAGRRDDGPDTTMSDQRGRVAVVTGGGRGLGRAIALGLAEAGARVAVVARGEKELNETVGLGAAVGGEIVAFPCDVSDVAAVERLRTDVQARLGHVSILVNAAGTFGPIALIADVDPVEWQRTITIDAVAPLFTARAFVGGMLEQGWGRIINVTSAASLHPPGPLNSAYGTAKAALNQMTRHLAAEIAGTGVTANVIHPGDVKTEMWADIKERVADAGPAGENYISWAAWVEETGGDPPEKAVDLVLRLTSDAGGDTNGMFCWIDDPLQAPIDSWDPPSEERPWMRD
jgi:NAD(P)-dependent dehydrogenase (short-subunit alcohol dehydrogenase family)